jgi:uncharacterized membrane-anchored protein
MVLSFRLVVPVLVLLLAAFTTTTTASADIDPETAKLFQSIEWLEGPATGALGDKATVQIPAGMAFTGKDGTKKWMAATHNLYDESMLGVVVPKDENAGWWAVFDYNDVGHISDSEKDKLNADDILKTLKENNDEANKELKKRGWRTVELVGWEKPPFYDTRTNNLTWSVRIRSESGREGVNHSVRLLGREGYMSADLVLSPEELASAIPAYESLLGGFTYTEGHRYAEYRKGDKLATYGLAALVAGGAGAVAMKTGLLAKFWKLIVVAVLGLFAAVKRFFKTILGWGRNEETIKPQ